MALVNPVLSSDITAKNLNILIVEDDELDFLAAQRQLEKIENFSTTITWAHSFDEALDLFSKYAYDLAFIDYRLGHLTGLDLLKEIHRENITLSTIILTGFWDREADMRAIRQGASDYLVKSEITPSLLERSICYALERQQKDEELKRLIRVDPLTGLLNRRGFEEILHKETSRAKRSHKNPIAILIDLDDFKKINDTFGHTAGDICLKEVAKKIQKALRPSDFASRVGGDEFLVLLPETQFEEGWKVAERIRLSLTDGAIKLSQGSAQTTASLGISQVKVESLSIDTLLSELHQALKTGKQSGKNKVCSYHEGGEIHSTQQDLIVSQLRQGEGIRALAQPIVSLSDGKIVGYEMLSRGPQGPLESPDSFFPFCMENNILINVDLICLEACLKRSLDFNSSLIHVNIFPATVFSSSVETLMRLFQSNLDKGQLCLEISEQQIIGDPSYMQDTIQELKKLGVAISMDDVGFGTSCLESLLFLEPDTIKIDKSCVNGVHKDKTKLKRLSKLVKIAQILNAKTVAEGIETEADWEVLRELGVVYGQGYLFGRPS